MDYLVGLLRAAGAGRLPVDLYLANGMTFTGLVEEVDPVAGVALLRHHLPPHRRVCVLLAQVAAVQQPSHLIEAPPADSSPAPVTAAELPRGKRGRGGGRDRAGGGGDPIPPAGPRNPAPAAGRAGRMGVAI